MKAQPMQQVDTKVMRGADVGMDSIANSSMLMTTSVLLLHVAIQDGSPRPWIEWTDLIVTILLAASAVWLFRIVRGSRTASVIGKQHRQRNPRTSTLVVHAPRTTS